MEEFPNSTPISHPIPPSSQLSLQALLEMNQVEIYAVQQHCSHHIKLLMQFENKIGSSYSSHKLPVDKTCRSPLSCLCSMISFSP